MTPVWREDRLPGDLAALCVMARLARMAPVHDGANHQEFREPRG